MTASRSCDRPRGSCMSSPRRACACVMCTRVSIREWDASITGCEAVRASPLRSILVYREFLKALAPGLRLCKRSCILLATETKGTNEKEDTPSTSFAVRSWCAFPDRGVGNARKRRNLRRSIWTFRFIYLPPSVIILG